MKKNVHESYQKTEFGIIPNDWKIRKLVECCNKITDGTHDTPKPVAQGIPFLTAIHVKDGFIDFNNCYYWPQIINESIYKRCNPEKNDVLMVNIGAGVATTALIDVEYEFSLKNVALLKPDKNNLIGSYLNYCLSFNKFRITNQLLSGGAQPFLSLRQIGEISIPIPPTIKEQKAIAQSLSDVDAQITALAQLITKKRNIKQSTMQQLLTGKKRLPGFSGQWEVKSLGEISLVSSGGTPNRNNPSYWNGNIPWITTSQIDFNTINSPDEFITEQGLNNSSAKIYEQGTLLMAMYGQGKTRGKVAILGIKATTNQACASIKLNQFTSNKYVFFYLSHKYDDIRKLSNNGNQENLNGEIIKSICIPIPSPAEQKAIAQVLSDMDAEIEGLEQKRDKYKAIKQGMMQELLTGKTRLL